MSRPLVAVVCSLFVLLTAMPALGQRFMPVEIVEAETITEEMNDRILAMVDPPMFDLVQVEVDPKEVSEAREQLLGLLRPSQPSAAYLDALSKAIGGRMADAVSHESPLVRMNAMIILASMVDDGSLVLIDKGMQDKNDAVKHWAVAALGKRVLWWKARIAANAGRGLQAKIDGAIAQINKLIDQAQPPHPIVVRAGFDALVKIDTSLSREALIELLNKRVPLHAADPDLTYAPERSAIESFTNILVSQVPPDMRSIKGYNRALFRYSSLIVDQAKANQIDQDKEKGAHTMLFLCLQGMANVSAAAKAPNSPPAAHNEAKGWIVNGRWDELDGLVNEGWRAIQSAAPFQLSATELQITP
ncbi:MAG: HEAT repeat domain-containing protein [Phycisphaeraceae bacterium]